jgi:glycosyltransferase involved in cell wall biosynthesis
LKKPQLVSFVLPVLREANGIIHFGESLIAVMNNGGLGYELLFVEDDSPDESAGSTEGATQTVPEV